MLLKLKQFIIKRFLMLLAFLPAHPKLILFESFQGKQYSCNPKAIYEYMLEHHPEHKMYWAVDRDYLENFTADHLKVVTRYSIKWLFLLGFSKYWIINSRMPKTIPKSRRTIYVQTWHGTPLKKLVFDMEDVHMPATDPETYKANFYQESRQWDYLVSPNGYSTEIFKRAFRFDNPIIESGYPRNDVLHHNHTTEQINVLKTKLGIPLDKKVILYAPTWRDNQFEGVGKYKFELPLNLDQLQKKYGSDYVILLRMHYFVSENFDLSSYEGFAYDFSQRVDINDLYLVSDLLITDYSSVFFDYGNLKKPILFYMYDLEEYRDTLRGFYFDIENEAPGPIVKDMDELILALEEFDAHGKYERSEENYRKFYDAYCYLEDGYSSKRFVERLITGVD